MAINSAEVERNGYSDGVLPKMPTLLTSPILRCQTSPILEPKLSPLLGFQASPERQTSPIFEPKLSPLLGFQASPELGCANDRNVVPLTVCGSREVETNASVVESVARLSDGKFIEDVDVTDASEEIQMLMEAVEALWCDRSVRFGGTCTELLNKNNGYKLTILSQAELVPSQGCQATSALIGFIVYKINAAEKKLSIARVAVLPEFRGHGYGRLFIEWCARYPGVSKLALTATARALGFYRAYGFRKVATWHQGGTAHPDEEPTDEQVYMEFQCRTGNSKGKKQRKARK
jgi:GNAT superfamily N-acetyltransferase